MRKFTTKGKALTITALLLAVALPVFASVQYFNSSDAELGHAQQVKCSSGLTCSFVSGKLVMIVSSMLGANDDSISNASDDVIEVASNDEHTILRVKGFEAKDASLQLYADEGDDNGDKFGLKYSASGVLTAELNGTAFLSVTASTGAFAFTGDISGDGGDQLYGFLQEQSASTTRALVAADCGKTIVGAGAHVLTLPEASTVLGCRYVIAAGTADDLDINPADGTDVIGHITASGGTITPSAGDAIRLTDIGSSVIIEAIGANLWAVIGHNGAITDVN